jgi:hypothetical protein
LRCGRHDVYSGGGAWQLISRIVVRYCERTIDREMIVATRRVLN